MKSIATILYDTMAYSNRELIDIKGIVLDQDAFIKLSIEFTGKPVHTGMNVLKIATAWGYVEVYQERYERR